MSIPGNGIHKGVAFEQYLALDHPSNSRLKDFDRAPAYCRARIDAHDEDETEFMKLGSAIHCAMLEPDHFTSRFCRKPKVLKPDGVTVWGPTAKAHQAEVGRLEALRFTLLTDAAFAMSEALCDTLPANRGARDLLEKATATEVSVVAPVWDLEAKALSELACKVRPDLLCESEGICGEVKSTTDGSPRAFAKIVNDRGYHRGAALYSDVLRAAGFDLRAYIFLVIETTPPFMARTYALTDSAIHLGRLQYQRSLRGYTDCLTTGVWPGAPDDVQPLDLPTYAYTNEENRT